MAIEYEVRDSIAYLTFCRPEKHNALRDEDIADLMSGLGRFDRDESALVAILSGQGRSFSSGAAVNGYCLGHALGTALLCDLVVAARGAVFQLTEITIGLPASGLWHTLSSA